MRFRNSNRIDIALAALVAVLVTGFFLWRSGPLVSWPALLVPFSLFGFTFAWTLWLARRRSAGLSLAFWLLLGAVLAHVIAWLPFLWRCYLIAQGPTGVDFALASGLFTATLVGWYVMGAHLWQTALLAMAAFALLVAAHRRETLQ